MVSNLSIEERIRILTEPNVKDRRFSGDRSPVDPREALRRAPELQKELLVLKASGNLALPDYEPGEKITRLERLAQTMALLSMLGINAILVHGGQESIDTAIALSNLTEEQKRLASLKSGEVRYTPQKAMDLIRRTAYALNEGLAEAIRSNGGYAAGFPSPMFVGIPRRRFVDKENHQVYLDSQYCELPIYDRIPGANVIPKRTEEVLDFLRQSNDGRGRIAVVSFLVSSQQPETLYGGGRKSVGIEHKAEVHAENGDADEVAAWCALYFAENYIIPEERMSERVRLLYLTRNGGLRASPSEYAHTIDLVASKKDIKQKVQGGMRGKVRTSLRTAKLLQRYDGEVRIMHPRELLPYLFASYAATIATDYHLYGTAFVSGGFDQGGYKKESKSHPMQRHPTVPYTGRKGHQRPHTTRISHTQPEA